MIAKIRHRQPDLRNLVVRYRDARKSLHTPGSQHSRRGLDWMNFFIADVQTGFGTFVAFYLAHLGWSQSRVGLALTVGGLAAVVSLIPGGVLADAVTWKQGLAALGILMIGAAALVLGLAPSYLAVLFAELLHGATASSRLQSVRLALAWLGGAPCRFVPAAIIAMPRVDML